MDGAPIAGRDVVERIAGGERDALRRTRRHIGQTAQRECLAGPGETVTVCDPVLALEAASVAVTFCDPLVLSVTGKEWTPLSAPVNVYGAGSTACASVEVRTTVPR